MSPLRSARAAVRALLATALAAAAGACAEAAVTPLDAPFTAPEPRGPSVGVVPDSVTRSPGLPPRATDATTRALGPRGDTLVVTQVSVFPAYQLTAGQVAPGTPTAGPMSVQVRVLVRDTSRSVLRTFDPPLAACPVALRLVRVPAGASDAPADAPAAWRADAAAGATACPAVTRYGPGDATVAWPVPALLGDSLPAGRYAVRYTVRLADGRTLDYAAPAAYLTASATPPARDFAALRLTAGSRVEGEAPRVLRTTVWVRNPTARSLRLEYGACALQLRLYRSAARTGTPVFRSEDRRPPGADVGYACELVLLGAVLPPGDSLPFALAVPLAEIPAGAVPVGRYFVAAELELLDDAAGYPNWRRPYTLAAGEVVVDRSPDRLPGTRTVDGLRYDATTRLVGDTVRTLVLVTNTAAAERQAEVPESCPVIAYAYPSAARRDSVPLVQPAWASTQPCRLTLHRFALAPGASWVFQHDVPATTLRARLGPGRAYFTAWIAGRPSVTLAAGDVEVP